MLVVLMLSGGEALEQRAVSRAGDVLASFAGRMPVVAHRKSATGEKGARKKVPATKSGQVARLPSFGGWHLFVLVLVAGTFSSSSTATDAGRWEKDVARFEQADREASPAPGSVILLGASNIRMWETLATDLPGMPVVNRGVGGCTLSELARFAPRLLAAGKPGMVVISAGSNDIHGGADADRVLVAWKEVIAAVRRDHPTVPILVMGILPAKSRWEERGTQEKANGPIRDAIVAEGGVMGGGPVEFLDVWADFLGADGAPDPEAFLGDELHPSALGNARRAARMRPVLKRLLAGLE